VDEQTSTLRINGDLEGEDVRLNVDGDLHISGCVIRAQGSVIIDGAVDPGVSITAHGDIRIAKSISGETTKVLTLGRLKCLFIRNSSVVAIGDIAIGNFLSNAKIKTGGALAVGTPSDIKGGSIVGGEAFATRGIEVRTVGLQSTDRTAIGLVPGPDLEARLSKLRRNTGSCQTDIQRIFRTLGLRQLNKTRLAFILEKAPPEKKKFIRSLMEKLLQLVDL
jgi:uncharacterized protein (DUF342 family)